MTKDLDTQFYEYFERVSQIKYKVAPDVMLRLYAFYKQATNGDHFSFNVNSNSDVINAFKFNAWIQLNGMSEEEAKKKYIKLAKTIL